MTTKIIEIRDSGTFIPALAIRLGSPNERERYLLARSGFGRTMEDQSEYIVLCKINGGEPCECHIDPFAWGRNPRTMFVAHLYLLNRPGELAADRTLERVPEKHDGFDSLPQGVVVDVEYILGMRANPKEPEGAKHDPYREVGMGLEGQR
jgi:hypothetical protein